MSKQFEIDLEGGLLDQFPDFMDCVRASAYSCGRPFKRIAADVDETVSSLSRKLADNPDDRVDYPLKKFVALLLATDDLRPLYWLIEKHCIDSNARRNDSLRRLDALLPEIARLVSDVKAGGDDGDHTTRNTATARSGWHRTNATDGGNQCR